jgi:hypothetical protein
MAPDTDAAVQQQPAVDPAALVERTGAATARLQHTFRIAHAALRDVGDDPDHEARVVRTDARNERRLVARLAGQANAALTDLLDALGAARDQVRWNGDAVAAIRAQLQQAERSVLVRDVEAVAALKARLLNVSVPHAELQVAISDVEPYLASFAAAVRRRVHACAVVARQLFVAAASARLASLREEVGLVQALRQAPDPVEDQLAAVRARVEARGGGALAVPQVSWPVAGKSGDPFQGPVLKD